MFRPVCGPGPPEGPIDPVVVLRVLVINIVIVVVEAESVVAVGVRPNRYSPFFPESIQC